MTDELFNPPSSKRPAIDLARERLQKALDAFQQSEKAGVVPFETRVELIEARRDLGLLEAEEITRRSGFGQGGCQ